MSTPRLRARVPSARAVSLAWLTGHRLRFHKQGRDASGKCDAEYTGNAADVVHGVLFEIAAADKPALDGAEGTGQGYDEKPVVVRTDDGREVPAFTYLATRTDSRLKPYAWYKAHVLRGAREHGLPAHYVATIQAVEAVPDPDSSRSDRELSVYARARAGTGPQA